MVSRTYTFEADLWLADVESTWVFLTVPADVSDEIEATVETKGGFGSVKVDVSIGETEWSTSLFPDKKRAAYVLPIKRAVRNAESVRVGDTVAVTFAVVDGADA